MAPTNRKTFSSTKKPSNAEVISVFKRRQAARGVVWSDVDMALLMQTIQLCIAENIGVGFYSASGGRGVCFKLYTGGKTPETEYASTADEMNELLDGVLDSLGYKQEDGSADLAAD